METRADLLPIKFLEPLVDVERRADGVIVVRSPEPLRPYARCWAVSRALGGGKAE
jgi:hypothetical protein